MRMTFQLLSIALVVTIIGLTDLVPSNKATAGNDECSNRMSEETSRYVRERKIPLKGADAEFYSNKSEQVYLLNSEETLKLDSRRTVKNTVAVVNHRDVGGKSGFYVIEQEITPGKITYSLKQDSRVLQTIPVALTLPQRSARATQIGPGQPCKDSDCAKIRSDKAAVIATATARANQTCETQKFCVQNCFCFAGKLSTPFQIMIVEPTSWRCGKLDNTFISAFWLVRETGGTLLEQAFETAVKKEAKLYTF